MSARKGFTLIELLVSIAILSLLIGILLPSLTAGRERARRVVCQSNLRQINAAIWSYSVANDGRVPWVVSPMTNGGGAGPSDPNDTSGLQFWLGQGVPGFGQPTASDADLDPFDTERWPRSLPNVLMATEVGRESKVFTCPSALAGWPRSGDPFKYAYREAAVNQISGGISLEGSYFREAFGFLDGRKLDVTPIHFTGNAISDAQLYPKAAATQVRDLVRRDPNGGLAGPHDGGINAVTRNFDIEFRDQKRLNDDLGTAGGSAGGVRF